MPGDVHEAAVGGVPCLRDDQLDVALQQRRALVLGDGAWNLWLARRCPQAERPRILKNIDDLGDLGPQLRRSGDALLESGVDGSHVEQVALDGDAVRRRVGEQDFMPAIVVTNRPIAVILPMFIAVPDVWVAIVGDQLCDEQIEQRPMIADQSCGNGGWRLVDVVQHDPANVACIEQ